MANDLRVLIPTSGRAQLLQRTLESLAACEKPAIYRETIVVENGPPGSAQKIAAAYGARYEYVAQANKSNALNEAMAQIPDRSLIFFADDDVRFFPNVLVHYAKAAENVHAGIFWGGATTVDYESPPPEWLMPLLPPDARGFSEEDYRRGSRVMVFLGFNWAAFAGDIRRAGGFDPRFGPGGTSGSIGQESEMQQKLLAVGARPAFLPEAMVAHYVPEKRCTPEWVLNRHYRFGILEAIHRDHRPVNPLGLPFWQLRRLGRSWLHWLRTRMTTDRVARFRARASLHYEWGRLQGCWALKRQSRQIQAKSAS